MELSIVIATRNSREFIGPCLESLVDTGGIRTEIIVVDNDSRDGTVDLVQAKYPAVRILRNPSNEGHCRAINRGMKAARGEFLMVLDADTVVHAGALASLVRFMRAWGAAVAAPRMLNADGTLQETARAFPTVANAIFGRQSLLTRLFPNNRFAASYLRRDRAAEIEPFEVDWVSAACMVFPRTLVERLGPWDEGFGGYWVDADWCARARVAGAVFCVPGARVVHVEQNRPTRRRGAHRVVQLHSGVFRFYRKHYTRGLLDPRAIAAATALSLRAAVLIAGDLAPLGRHVR
jgi:hypothetical protein